MKIVIKNRRKFAAFCCTNIRIHLSFDVYFPTILSNKLSYYYFIMPIIAAQRFNAIIEDVNITNIMPYI